MSYRGSGAVMRRGPGAVVGVSGPIPIPPPPPPPPPPPTPDPAGRLINGDLSTGNFNQIAVVQNKFYNQVGSNYPENTYYSLTMITDPTVPAELGHTNVARFETRNGDWPGFAHGERSEMRPSDLGATLGQTRWYQWYTKFDATYPAAHDGFWCIQAQFHGNDLQSPPFSFSTYNNAGGTNSPANRWALQIGSGGTGLGIWSTPLNRGSWHKMKMQILFKQDNTGWIRMWRNDTPQVFDNGTTQRFCTTMNAGTNQACTFQCGTYRGDQTVSGGTDIVYHTGFRMGTTEASVV